MYLEFDCFERTSLAVLLLLMSIIVSDVRIYVSVRGKYFLKVLVS